MFPDHVRESIIPGGLVVVAVACISALTWHYRERASGGQTPPGPKGIPIFGNEFQIPRDKQWLKFHEWSQKYGTLQISGSSR